MKSIYITSNTLLLTKPTQKMHCSMANCKTHNQLLLVDDVALRSSVTYSQLQLVTAVWGCVVCVYVYFLKEFRIQCYFFVSALVLSRLTLIHGRRLDALS